MANNLQNETDELLTKIGSKIGLGALIVFAFTVMAVIIALAIKFILWLFS